MTGSYDSRRRDHPKLSIKNNHEERGNAITSPDAMFGRPTARQAVGGIAVRSQKKQRPFCNDTDRVWDITHVKTGIIDSSENDVLTSDRCFVAR
jgi:hypothetical protein